MPASAFAIEIGELIPSGIFLLLALVLPFVFYHVGGGFLHRLQKHLPEWLCILTESYLKPLAWALRQTLFFAAVGLLPLVQKHATVADFLGTLSTLLNIYFLALGAWRSAPMCRLLLRSAQNHLDLATNQTMARFFENIFRALVLLFAGIAMLDTMGVPVTGLLTGAGRCRHRHLACGAVHPIEPHCRCSAGAGASLWNWGLHRAGQSGGHGGGYFLPLHQVPHAG